MVGKTLVYICRDNISGSLICNTPITDFLFVNIIRVTLHYVSLFVSNWTSYFFMISNYECLFNIFIVTSKRTSLCLVLYSLINGFLKSCLHNVMYEDILYISIFFFCHNRLTGFLCSSNSFYPEPILSRLRWGVRRLWVPTYTSPNK